MVLELHHRGTFAQPPLFRRRPALQRTYRPSRGAGQRGMPRKSWDREPVHAALASGETRGAAEPRHAHRSPPNPVHPFKCPDVGAGFKPALPTKQPTQTKQPKSNRPFRGTKGARAQRAGYAGAPTNQTTTPSTSATNTQSQESQFRQPLAIMHLTHQNVLQVITIEKPPAVTGGKAERNVSLHV